jgi:hypothetical protein
MTLLNRINEARELKLAYKETFETPHGQKVLRHLLHVSGVTQARFSKDADEIRWNEAQRHFVMSIFNQVHGSMSKLPDYLAEEIKAKEAASQ